MEFKKAHCGRTKPCIKLPVFNSLEGKDRPLLTFYGKRFL